MNPGEGLKCSQYKLAGKMEGTSSGEYDTFKTPSVYPCFGLNQAAAYIWVY